MYDLGPQAETITKISEEIINLYNQFISKGKIKKEYKLKALIS